MIYEVMGCAIEVHKHLGPGLLESHYERCMIYELQQKGLNFKSQHSIPLNYKSTSIECVYRCDLIVEDMLIIELKAIEYVLPVHHAQLLSYMQILKIPKGLLLNFNVSNIWDEGQKTFVNKYYRSLAE